MPRLLKEYSKPSQYPSKQLPAQTAEPAEAANGKALFSVKLKLGKLELRLETRFALIASIILPLYILAAFVGNDWAYMLPCTLLAALVIGVLLPLIETASIGCACKIVKNASTQSEELYLKAWRRHLFGLLTDLIPSGYLNARLHLCKRSWGGSKSAASELVPLPVVLHSLSHGLELRVPAPELPRGVYELESLEISSCFPFAIAWCSRKIKIEGESSALTYLPARREIPGNFHSRLSSGQINSGRNQRRYVMNNRSTALKGLREFTERDSLNHIHWAASARSGKLMVREFEIESLPDYDVYIDLARKWSDKQLDLACASAYALVHYAGRSGFVAQLKLNPPMDWPPFASLLEDISPGLDHEELLLQILARLNRLPEPMLKSLVDFKETQQLSALDLASEVSASGRCLIEILPEEKGVKGAGILISENWQAASPDKKPSSQVPGMPAAATSVGVVARLEAEAELARL